MDLADGTVEGWSGKRSEERSEGGEEGRRTREVGMRTTRRRAVGLG
jgi:hypothetical protein